MIIALFMGLGLIRAVKVLIHTDVPSSWHLTLFLLLCGLLLQSSDTPNYHGGYMDKAGGLVERNCGVEVCKGTLAELPPF